MGGRWVKAARDRGIVAQDIDRLTPPYGVLNLKSAIQNLKLPDTLEAAPLHTAPPCRLNRAVFSLAQRG